MSRQAMISKVYGGCCLLALVLLAAGCEERGLRLSIRYDRIHNLQKDAPVYFQGTRIGRVTRIFYEAEGAYTVDVWIADSFANAATEDSRFTIADDPQSRGARVVRILQARSGGIRLKQGSTVEGVVGAPLVPEGLWGDLQQGLEFLEQHLQQFGQKLRRLPEQEEFKSLKEELHKLARELRQSEKAARDRLKKEVLPKIQEELEKLRKKLRDLNRENDLGPLQEQIDRIADI